MRRWHFQCVSKSQNRVLSLEEAALAGVYLGPLGFIEHHPDLILQHFTGMYDSDTLPLFEDDIVSFDQITEFGLVQQIGFMKWVNDHYAISMDGSKEQVGKVYDTQNVRKIGNRQVSPELLQQKS